MKIVYITGCLGFIGSHLTRECLRLGWKVFGIDKETYVANKDSLKEFLQHENFKFLKIDIKDLNHLYDCDYIINTAAESHVGNSIIDSTNFIESNILGVKNLLDLIRNKQENCNRRPILLQFSTDEVYGDILVGSHSEQDLLKPSNPYSAAKASADMLITAWARTYGTNYIIVRPTNNYGIGQYPEKLVPLSIKNLQRGLKIRLHNNGTPKRNWLHVQDTVESIIKIIKSGVYNEIYNIDGNCEQTNLQTVKKIIELYHGTHEWEQYIDFSYLREGQDLRYSLDDTKIKGLGWKPIRVFDNEIQKIVEYYKDIFIW